MTLQNISSIAEAITHRLEIEHIGNIENNMTVHIEVTEEDLKQIDEECFKLTHQEKPFQKGDVLQIKIGEINFKISKKENV